MGDRSWTISLAWLSKLNVPHSICQPAGILSSDRRYPRTSLLSPSVVAMRAASPPRLRLQRLYVSVILNRVAEKHITASKDCGPLIMPRVWLIVPRVLKPSSLAYSHLLFRSEIDLCDSLSYRVKSVCGNTNDVVLRKKRE